MDPQRKRNTKPIPTQALPLSQFRLRTLLIHITIFSVAAAVSIRLALAYASLVVAFAATLGLETCAESDDRAVQFMGLLIYVTGVIAFIGCLLVASTLSA